MQTYRVAHTDLQVSRIGYGCMNIGGGWNQEPFSPDERSAAFKAVQTACEQGITLFDHADIYTFGKSEAVFGELLREQPGLRDRLVLQSKCGIRFPDDPGPGAPARYDFSAEHIRRSVEGSLRRLGTEYLDLLLLHRPDALVEPEEVASAFDQLRRSGKVRYFGVSNHTAAQIALLQAYLDQPLVVNQLELNLVHHHLINDGIVANQLPGAYAATGGTLEYCRLHKIRIQAWAPVASGRILSPPADAPAQRRQLAELVERMAAEKGTSGDAILLAWLLRHPAGIQPLIGSTRPERIVAGCQADQVELSREEWYLLLTAARGQNVP